MPRMVVIKNATDIKTLRTSLLRANVSDAQAASALADLQALNQHVNPAKIPAGTVLLVPDAPSFDAAASEPIATSPFDALRERLRIDLTAASKRLKAGNEMRAAQRADIASVQKSAAFKKIVDKDPELQKQVEEAGKALKEDEKQAADAEKKVAAAIDDTMAELDALGKLFGNA